MKVDVANSNLSVVPPPSQLQKHQSARQPQLQNQNETSPVDTSAKKSDNVTDEVTIHLELPQNTLETLQKIGSVGELLVSTAKNVRQTNEALNLGVKHLEEMKTTLEKIIKNYPPFPSESKERMELLMSYSGLRKEITNLMVPSPPPPVYEKIQHVWDNLFSVQSRSIQAPHLPIDAPDSHVKIVVGQLDNLKKQVGLVQEAMGNTIKVT